MVRMQGGEGLDGKTKILILAMLNSRWQWVIQAEMSDIQAVVDVELDGRGELWRGEVMLNVIDIEVILKAVGFHGVSQEKVV